MGLNNGPADRSHVGLSAHARNKRRMRLAGAMACVWLAWSPVASAAATCFKNTDAYMAAAFGQRYKVDANLVVTERRYGAQMFTEIADETGGTNVALTLLTRDGRRGLCHVLTTFPVVGLKMTRSDKHGKPLELTGRDQAPGNQASNEITYALGPSGIFVASVCRKIRYDDANDSLVTLVPCKDMLAELGGEPSD